MAGNSYQLFGAGPKPAYNTGAQTLGETILGYAKATATLAGTHLTETLRATTAGAAGNLITLTTVADGAGAGSFTRVGNALTFHYQSGVTTVANFEAAVAALAGADDLFEVTGAAAAGTLASPGDTIGPVAFTGGTSALAGIVHPDPEHGHWSVQLGIVGTPTGTVKFAYSNLPNPDITDDNHWVVSTGDTITLSGADKYAFVSAANKVSEHLRVRIELTAGSATAWGWTSGQGR